MKEIIIATLNNHKFKEISAILSIPNVKFRPMYEFPNIEKIDETGNSFEENALIKAKQVNKHTGLISLADDSGLEISALENKPGIHSSRFLGEKTDYKIKNEKILELLKNVSSDKRQARFVCSIAIYFDQNNYQVVTASCEGMIENKICGINGFGYDPIFLVPEYKKTFAELDDNIKNKISHRAKALQKAKKVLVGYFKGENYDFTT